MPVGGVGVEHVGEVRAGRQDLDRAVVPGAKLSQRLDRALADDHLDNGADVEDLILWLVSRSLAFVDLLLLLLFLLWLLLLLLLWLLSSSWLLLL